MLLVHKSITVSFDEFFRELDYTDVELYDFDLLKRDSKSHSFNNQSTLFVKFSIHEKNNQKSFFRESDYTAKK